MKRFTRALLNILLLPVKIPMFCMLYVLGTIEIFWGWLYEHSEWDQNIYRYSRDTLYDDFFGDFFK